MPLIFRNVLELVKEHNLSSVAIPLIYTVKKGYPPDEGAHLALSKQHSNKFLCLRFFLKEPDVVLLDENVDNSVKCCIAIYKNQVMQRHNWARVQLSDYIAPQMCISHITRSRW
jgi:hypothetical protein